MISFHCVAGTSGASIAAVGIWDPIENFTWEVLREFITYYSGNFDSLAIIIFWPRPNAFDGDYFLYNDLWTRVRIFRELGLSVYVCKLDVDGAKAGAEEFFSALVRFTNIRTLYLRDFQTLGRGDGGTVATTDLIARERRIVIDRHTPSNHERVPTQLLNQLGRSATYDPRLRKYGVFPLTRVLSPRPFRELYLQEGVYRCGQVSLLGYDISFRDEGWQLWVRNRIARFKPPSGICSLVRPIFRISSLGASGSNLTVDALV